MKWTQIHILKLDNGSQVIGRDEYSKEWTVKHIDGGITTYCDSEMRELHNLDTSNKTLNNIGKQPFHGDRTLSEAE